MQAGKLLKRFFEYFLRIFARFLTVERYLALLTLDVIRSKGNRNANMNAKRSD